MRLLTRFFRIYTPFVCNLFTLLNGVFFLFGNAEGEFTRVTSALSGSSILVVLFMLSASTKMCIWYKTNLFCLMLTQILGLVYDNSDMEFAVYLWLVVLFCSLGLICFLVFRLLYVVTDSLGCNRRHLVK